MPSHRVYIDESGDHTYQSTENLSRRYLALTGVVVDRAHYEASIVPALNALKRKHFADDPDKPVILHRIDILKRKGPFRVLQDPKGQAAWDHDLVEFLRTLRAQVFTVVLDKQVYRGKHLAEPPDAYHHALQALLWRIRGYLHIERAGADVFAEARGKREDAQLLQAYREARTSGTSHGPAPAYRAAFPEDELTVRRKEHNVLGLQIADLLVSDQKIDIAIRSGKPTAKAPSALARRLIDAAEHMIDQDGRVWLD